MMELHQCVDVEVGHDPTVRVGQYAYQLSLRLVSMKLGSSSEEHRRTTATKPSRQPVDAGSAFYFVNDNLSALGDALPDRRRVVQFYFGVIPSGGDNCSGGKSLSVNFDALSISTSMSSVPGC